jgi:phage gpG-like protein
MRITAEIAAERAIAEFDALPGKVRASARDAVAEDGARLVSIVQAKLSGDVLQSRSGALLRSIKAETNEDADGVGVRVFSDGSVPYARIQEYGGRIAVPQIVPVEAKALAFAYGGRMVFAKSAAAHVVDIPERSYMRSSLDEFAAAFVADIRKIVTDALA